MFVQGVNQTKVARRLASTCNLRLTKGFQKALVHNWASEASPIATATNKGEAGRPKVLGYFSGGIGSFSRQTSQAEGKPQSVPLGKAWANQGWSASKNQQRPPFFQGKASGTESSERVNTKHVPELPRGKALLQAKIDKTIRKRLEKTRKETSSSAQERAPRDEEIRHPMITLITLDGVVDGVHPLSHVLKTLDRKEYTLVLVDTNRSPPACRVFSRKLLYEKERQAKKSMKAAMRSTKQQTVQMSATIGDHDLGIKVKKALDLMEKGRRVMMVVEHRGKAKVDDRRKEVGNKIMDLVKDKCTVPSPPAMDGRTWSVILQAKTKV
ncbi:hypothetical protein LPJ57_002634 [Coemansia sp. RSA 486]|nr:hypothetical protein LPJ57_002634 [Coemansia sp. RSA 486]KAJ2220685.1 hypothetical protein IWW45_009052 [Coemansia sp. RSA 485]KAJ2601493.1 hypothetical protein GGF39_001212 [Coemansia sp. RSA 1721]